MREFDPFGDVEFNTAHYNPTYLLVHGGLSSSNS